MKSLKFRALRLTVFSLVAFGVLAAAILIFVDRLRAESDRSRVENTYYQYHAVGLDIVNARGKHFVVDDLHMIGDKLTLQYHASGVVPIKFTDIGSNPLYRNQPPTLITVTSEGSSFVPYDATAGAQEGTTIHGEFIWSFTGKAPDHLDISVARLMGDTDATWTLHVDN